MRRRDRAQEDEIIDLTERLAPYSDSALRPTQPFWRRTKAVEEEADAPLWSPLDLGSLYENR
ncbi:MAG: hypothetical protein ABWZ76_05385 [Acidimicrobiales bacterium]